MAAGSAPKRTTRAKKTTRPAATPAAPAAVKKIQVVLLVDPDMIEALDAFKVANGLASRAEAGRVFLERGRASAERWGTVKSPDRTAYAPRAPRTGQRSA